MSRRTSGQEMKYRTAICDAADKAMRLLHRAGYEYEEGTIDLCGWLLYVYCDVVKLGDSELITRVIEAIGRARTYYETEVPPTRKHRRLPRDPNQN